MRNIQFDEIDAFHKAVFTRADLDEETCEAVSFGLYETHLRGVDSHGIRLLPHYARSALLGRKNPRPNYHVNLVSGFNLPMILKLKKSDADKKGIPVDDSLLNQFQQLSSELNVEMVLCSSEN